VADEITVIVRVHPAKRATPAMNTKNFHSTVERLEPRRLCSATHFSPAVNAPQPFPNLVGRYDGTAIFTNGASTAETLTITKQQKNGSFVGNTTQTNGANGKVTGFVTRLKKVHFVDRGTLVKFVSVGNGTFANGVLTIKFVAVQARHTLRGTLTLINVAQI
jgi:hypothetical protein